MENESKRKYRYRVFSPIYKGTDDALYALSTSSKNKWIVIRKNDDGVWHQVYVEEFDSKKDAEVFIRMKARSNTWTMMSR